MWMIINANDLWWGYFLMKISPSPDHLIFCPFLFGPIIWLFISVLNGAFFNFIHFILWLIIDCCLVVIVSCRLSLLSRNSSRRKWTKNEIRRLKSHKRQRTDIQSTGSSMECYVNHFSQDWHQSLTSSSFGKPRSKPVKIWYGQICGFVTLAAIVFLFCSKICCVQRQCARLVSPSYVGLRCDLRNGLWLLYDFCIDAVSDSYQPFRVIVFPELRDDNTLSAEWQTGISCEKARDGKIRDGHMVHISVSRGICAPA